MSEFLNKQRAEPGHECASGPLGQRLAYHFHMNASICTSTLGLFSLRAVDVHQDSERRDASGIPWDI